jgi:hypothetical protein
MEPLGPRSVSVSLPQRLQPPDWLRRASEARPALVFHTKGPHGEKLLTGGFRLLGALASHAAGQGWDVQAVEFTPESPAFAVTDTRHIHVLMEDYPAFGPRVFHAVPGYLRGWWFFDELATRNNSTIRFQPFDPRSIKDAFATRFADRLRAQFAARNFTKFSQRPRGAEVVPMGCLAFFAQGFTVPPHQTHYAGVLDLARSTIAARGLRPVVIKTHPKNSLEELEALAALHDPAIGVHVTDASIHDILDVCACVVTVTSAVAFEGFLHGKPAIVAGQVDYPQNVITLTNPARLSDAINAALSRDWPHDRFVTWYLRQHCLEDRAESLPRVLERLHRKGLSLGDVDGQGWF